MKEKDLNNILSFHKKGKEQKVIVCLKTCDITAITEIKELTVMHGCLINIHDKETTYIPVDNIESITFLEE